MKLGTDFYYSVALRGKGKETGQCLAKIGKAQGVNHMSCSVEWEQWKILEGPERFVV